MRAGKLVLGLAFVTALGGCGTIVDGGSQKVNVIVKGSPGAFCSFTNKSYRNEGQFPNTVVLQRAREDLMADCTGEQNRHVSFIVPSHLTGKGTAGNIVTGLIPGTAYDAATGGMWAYPDPIIVDFREIGEGPKPAWPADTVDDQIDRTRVGTADITPPKPVRMQPVMDDELNPALGMREAPKPAIIDAVRIAVDKQPPATAKPAVTGKAKPVISPEDAMGLEPGKVKAKEEAAAKAKVEAAEKKKAAAAAKKREAAAKKKAETEAKKAAEEAAKALPETPATPPAEPAAKAAEPAAAATPAEPAATPSEPAPQPAPVVNEVPPAEPQASTTTTTTTTTVPVAPKSDIDKYLEGN